MPFTAIEIFVLLFSLIGPLKPTVILAGAAANSDASDAEVRAIAFRATVAAASILTVFFFLGEVVLNAFKVSIPAFQIGGAIVVFIFAIQTILEDPQRSKQEGQSIKLSPNMSVYPLAMPLMASPAALILIISLVSSTDGFMPLIPLIICAALVVSIDYVFMRNCRKIASMLSPPVMLTLGKVIAILLVGLSVELVFVGLDAWGVVSVEGLKASG